MVLVDTSVWTDFLCNGGDGLSQLLTQGLVYIHPMVIGELACGHLKNRAQLLTLWQSLPKTKEASHMEVMHMLEQHQLMGRGIGYVDLHLLSATLLTSDTFLWTRDKRLADIANELSVGVAIY